MKKKDTSDMLLDPSKRLCPQFDPTGIALYRVAERGKEMGVRVADNCAQEHIM